MFFYRLAGFVGDITTAEAASGVEASAAGVRASMSWALHVRTLRHHLNSQRVRQIDHLGGVGAVACFNSTFDSLAGLANVFGKQRAILDALEDLLGFPRYAAAVSRIYAIALCTSDVIASHFFAALISSAPIASISSAADS